MRKAKEKHAGLQPTVRWIPGHAEVEGNEWADEEAKEAAKERGIDRAKLPRVLKAKDAVKKRRAALDQAFDAKLRKRAQKGWRTSPRYARMTKLGLEAPSKRLREVLASMSRRRASVVTQLITGHIPLAQYLHRIKRAASLICPRCGLYDETTTHYLTQHTAHRAARERLQVKRGGYGGTGRRV